MLREMRRNLYHVISEYSNSLELAKVVVSYMGGISVEIAFIISVFKLPFIASGVRSRSNLIFR